MKLIKFEEAVQEMEKGNICVRKLILSNDIKYRIIGARLEFLLVGKTWTQSQTKLSVLIGGVWRVVEENKKTLSEKLKNNYPAVPFCCMDLIIKDVKEHLKIFIDWLSRYGELGHIKTESNKKAKEIFGDDLIE